MASNRNTFIRSLHDLGAAAWFGGNLMGAAGMADGSPYLQAKRKNRTPDPHANSAGGRLVSIVLPDMPRTSPGQCPATA